MGEMARAKITANGAAKPQGGHERDDQGEHTPGRAPWSSRVRTIAAGASDEPSARRETTRGGRCRAAARGPRCLSSCSLTVDRSMCRAWAARTPAGQADDHRPERHERPQDDPPDLHSVRPRAGARSAPRTGSGAATAGRDSRGTSRGRGGPGPCEPRRSRASIHATKPIMAASGVTAESAGSAPVDEVGVEGAVQRRSWRRRRRGRSASDASTAWPARGRTPRGRRRTHAREGRGRPGRSRSRRSGVRARRTRSRPRRSRATRRPNRRRRRTPRRGASRGRQATPPRPSRLPGSARRRRREKTSAPVSPAADTRTSSPVRAAARSVMRSAPARKGTAPSAKATATSQRGSRRGSVRRRSSAKHRTGSKYAKSQRRVASTRQV